VTPLLDKRLIFVTGKGGVGKTTVSAALGLVAARRGQRTIVCEVAQQERMSRILHPGGASRRGVGFTETELASGLFAISIDPERALEEYLRHQIRSGTLYRLLFENRVFQYFAAATPGMRELVTMGKIWELAQLQRRTAKAAPYDLVIVDSPATGHGLGMLATPRTFRDVARVGPIRRQANMIHSFIVDPSATGVAVVALPEEIPVAETLDFRRRLREKMGMELDAVVVNGIYPERFTALEAERLAAAAVSPDGRVSEPAAAALRAALAEHRRARFQRGQLRRLRREGLAIALPYLFEREIGLESLERLSRELERKL
jgi:anion-transporting  ArsA/GET3 family ATPase